MSVQIIRDALISAVGNQVGHYEPDKSWKDGYAVYGETGAPVMVSGDDEALQLVLTGEAYYYTTTEFDKTVDAICNAFTAVGVSWSVVQIGYDADLKQISYQIHWEVACGPGEIY